MSQFDAPPRRRDDQRERQDRPATFPEIGQWLSTELKTENSRFWTQTLGSKLGRLPAYLGAGKLWAVDGDRVSTYSPFYHESERGGSPYRWTVTEVQTAPLDAPAPVLAALRPKMEAAAAQARELERAQRERQELAERMRPTLEPKIAELSGRLQTIGLKEIILAADGFYPKDRTWESQPYSDEAVAKLEAEVVAAEQAHNERMAFATAVETLRPHMKEIGLTINDESKTVLRVYDGTVFLNTFPIEPTPSVELFQRTLAGLEELKLFVRAAEKTTEQRLAEVKERADEAARLEARRAKKLQQATTTMGGDLEVDIAPVTTPTPPTVPIESPKPIEVPKLVPDVKLEPAAALQVVQDARLYEAIVRHCIRLAEANPEIDPKWSATVATSIGDMMRSIISRAKSDQPLTDRDQTEVAKVPGTFLTLFNREKQLTAGFASQYKGQVDRWRKQFNDLLAVVNVNRSVADAIELDFAKADMLAAAQRAFLDRIANGGREVDSDQLVTDAVNVLTMS